MTPPRPPVLEFPAMLHGLNGAVVRNVRSMGKAWAREYLKAGTFTAPRRMLEVSPGEVLVVDGGADSNLVPQVRWRLHLFSDALQGLRDGAPDAERQRMEASFESFCLSTPWGALFHVVSFYPPWSAERTAKLLTALLRFWDVLQGPRYAFWHHRDDTLEELMEDLYGMTLKGWCPEGAGSVREQVALTAERMSRANREDCLAALLRMIPLLVRANTHLKHRDVLVDPDFLRDRLAALSPEDWENISSAHRYAVGGPLYAWDKVLLGRHQPRRLS